MLVLLPLAYLKSLMCLVYDGASSNLAVLKKLCGTEGQFECDLSSADPFQVPCSFRNAFSDALVWCVVCPRCETANGMR